MEKIAEKLVGRIIGRYEILKHHRSGGMSIVYLARHTITGKEVALKTFRTGFLDELDNNQRSEFDERFRREAQAAAQIGHKNIVEVYDFDFAQGDLPAYMVMEFLRGESLEDLLKREGKLTTERALNLMLQICIGIGSSHNKGVVHRDLKPANIIIIPPHEEGEKETVKIVDFGIAKIFDSELTKITKYGHILGTAKYMSPEQCRSQQDEEPDARSDIYSLGLIFYEMLSGKFPYYSSSYEGWLICHLMEKPMPLSSEFLPEINEIIMQALDKERERRPKSAIELYEKIKIIGKLELQRKVEEERKNLIIQLKKDLKQEDEKIFRREKETLEQENLRLKLDAQRLEELSRSYQIKLMDVGADISILRLKLDSEKAVKQVLAHIIGKFTQRFLGRRYSAGVILCGDKNFTEVKITDNQRKYEETTRQIPQMVESGKFVIIFEEKQSPTGPSGAFESSVGWENVEKETMQRLIGRTIEIDNFPKKSSLTFVW